MNQEKALNVENTLIDIVMEEKKFMCAKCGKVEVSYEGAYCDECKGSFDDRCDKFRSAINSVKETGDWRKDWIARRDAINGMFR